MKVSKVIGVTLEVISGVTLVCMMAVDLRVTESMTPVIFLFVASLVTLAIGYLLSDTRRIGRNVFPVVAIVLCMISSKCKHKSASMKKLIKMVKKSNDTYGDAFYSLRDKYDEVHGTPKGIEDYRDNL